MKQGLGIQKVLKQSSAFEAGLKANDRVLSVNGSTIEDEIDAYFWTAQSDLELRILRGLREKTILLIRDPQKPLGIVWHSTSIQRCQNKCVFCFIDQLPKGLRKSLYIKDEDYRHSFLNGNYMTLTSLDEPTSAKIVEYHLSPLFVSVHATDPLIRQKLLGGNKKAGLLLTQLRNLSKRGIRFHCQIVVCPGINDGVVLTKTIRDLLAFRRAVLSIAVVPVGLTDHRTKHLDGVTADDANIICKQVTIFSDADTIRLGKRRVFLADEFFIKADIAIPKAAYYQDYPQIENGVGLVRQLLEEWKQLSHQYKPKRNRKIQQRCNKHALIITATSAFSFLNEIVHQMQQTLRFLYSVEIIAVENKFLGSSVTVAGLLCGKDVAAAIQQNPKKDLVILPDVMFNFRGYTLDGYSIKRLEKMCKTPIKAARGISDLIQYLTHRQ